MAKIIGSFYLKQTSNGNLTGEYTNNTLFTVSTESAVLKEAGTEPFSGRYFSTWYERDVAYSAELIIKPLENVSHTNAKYMLVWIDKVTGPVYEAEAFVAEGMLIGHYISLS